MLAQVVLREIDIALYIVQQLFQPFLTMHIGSSRTDIGQHVPFAELARFHELLKTVADVLIEDNFIGDDKRMAFRTNISNPA